MHALTDLMNWKAMMALALALVMHRMYRSSWRMHMKVVRPMVCTGVVLEKARLPCRICVRKVSAASRLRAEAMRGGGRQACVRMQARFRFRARARARARAHTQNNAWPPPPRTHPTSSLYRRSIRMSPRRFMK